PGITSEDGSMALYSGTCGNLTQIKCASDNAAYPGPLNNTYLPYIDTLGLIPGNTYFIRYWSFGCGNGTFGLCLQTTTNDACANAINICDLNNGYSSSTSAAYTADWPSNMLGNDEVPVTHVSNGGVNSGGVFGKPDAAGDANTPASEGTTIWDVSIQNNSWVRFTAASTKVTLTVSVGTCFKSPAQGIQMQIFSTTPNNSCTTFAPAAPFYQSTTGFTMSANNLVIGNSYIIMIDGFNGDVCNYTIDPGSGVAFPDIVVSATPVCIGNSATLQAPAGATSYSWSTTPVQTTQIITVTPGTDITYTCVVTGSCGEKQTLTAPVSVSSACAALPITLVSFDAIYKGGENAYLLWETATETNNGFFTVERSTDASTFKQVGPTVRSKAEGGNSTTSLKYSLVDPDVYRGVYYYRLKQTDLDGTSTYSGVAEIHIDNSDVQFGVKPNPTSDRSEVLFTAFENSTALMRVIDSRGAVLSVTEIPAIKGTNIVYVHLDEEPEGIYIITLNVNEKMYRTKLVKRNN
ncbi:MAG TPA: T9SS type A sorting domain-containing protein, partial [Bacteroidia bacterium]|nr:T9SS type A sorting domain-containing protein [Bacteroidia bacterium]